MHLTELCFAFQQGINWKIGRFSWNFQWLGNLVVEFENHIKISIFFQNTGNIPKNRYFEGMFQSLWNLVRYRIDLLAYFSEIHSEFPVVLQNAGRIPKNRYFCGNLLWLWKLEQVLIFQRSSQKCTQNFQHSLKKPVLWVFCNQSGTWRWK